MAVIIEADKTDNLNMEEMNNKMVQMLMETVEKLNAAQKAMNEKEENYMKIAIQETPQTWNNDANRLQILESSIARISTMLFNMQNHQSMMINQNCVTQQAYDYPPQCPQPYDYPPQYPQPADPVYEMPQNFNNRNPRSNGRNYDPAYVPKRPSLTQNQAQSKRKRNQEN